MGGSFNCSYNQLTSLKGSPQSVDGYFDSRFNELTTLEGSPKSVGGDFYCSYNVVEFNQSDVLAVCDVKGRIYV